MHIYKMSLQALAHWLRHHVLDIAHPLPEYVKIYPGPRSSLGQYLIVYTTAAVNSLDNRVQLLDYECECNTTTRFDKDGVVRGAIPICRYLGRIWKMYPVDPRNAMTVDGLLELMPALLSASDWPEYDEGSMPERILAVLEENLLDSQWLAGFESPTIADVCWYAVCCWFQDRMWDDTTPNATQWFQRMHTVVPPSQVLAPEQKEDLDGGQTASADNEHPHDE